MRSSRSRTAPGSRSTPESTSIVQPGGSRRDQDVIDAVAKAGAAHGLHGPPALPPLNGRPCTCLELAGRRVPVEELPEPGLVDRRRSGRGDPRARAPCRARRRAPGRSRRRGSAAPSPHARRPRPHRDCWPLPLLFDLVVQRREVDVERLRRRPVHDRLHFVRERLELLVPAAERIRRVDRRPCRRCR